MSEQLPNVETRISALSSELSTLKELIKAGFQKVENNFDVVKKDVESIHKKIEVIHKKIEVLAKRVESLDTSTNDGFSDVGMKIESLTDEIAKIGAVTSYEEQYKNMQGLN